MNFLEEHRQSELTKQINGKAMINESLQKVPEMCLICKMTEDYGPSIKAGMDVYITKSYLFYIPDCGMNMIAYSYMEPALSKMTVQGYGPLSNIQ